VTVSAAVHDRGTPHASNVTTELLHLLVGTFLLGAASAGLAAEINSGLKPYLAGSRVPSSVLYYSLVVDLGEEAGKLLAVRLLPYGSDRFSTVLDGAVDGSMAGMGFAFIENAISIRRSLAVPELEFGLSLLATGSAITATRAIAGPGHVISSAFAGYYLGLAKFNPEQRGPLVLKGILIAAALHGLYNATVGFGSAVVGAVTGLSGMGALLVYVLLFDGLWGAVLFRKVERYRLRTTPSPPTGTARSTTPRPTPPLGASSALPTESGSGSSQLSFSREIPTPVGVTTIWSSPFWTMSPSTSSATCRSSSMIRSLAVSVVEWRVMSAITRSPS
jgi:RsiW-degrading membrane proteinase PrsW (M82 family)